jgi:membrane-associated protein
MDFAQLSQLVLHFDQHIASFTAQYGLVIYALLFAIVFSEIALIPLFFLPGDPLLFLCGAFCASAVINIWVVMPVLFVATISGSAVSYGIGKSIGQQVFTREYRWLDKAALNRSHAFYERYGGVTFLLSPFIAVVRTFAPFIAGVSTMTFSKFILSVSAGAALWVGTLVIGGYFLGNVAFVHDHMNAIVLSGIGLGVGGLVLSAIYRYVKTQRQTQRQTRR